MDYRKQKYTPETALANVLQHSIHKKLDNWHYILKGSFGNKISGQIDYLRNYTDVKVEIITQQQFEIIK